MHFHAGLCKKETVKMRDKIMNNTLPCNFSLTNYQAAIFDLDGTLVDSSVAIRHVLSDWCLEHKIDLEQLLQDCQGVRIIDFLPKIVPHLDVEKEANYLANLEAIITTGLVEIIGAKAFLDYLTKINMPWAIATSGTEPVAKLRLKTCQLEQPKVFITSEKVIEGKPNPEPFSLAVRELGQQSKHCLAFEDSLHGVNSALSAGCDVIIIGNECNIEHINIVARLDDYQTLLTAISAERMETC